MVLIQWRVMCVFVVLLESKSASAPKSSGKMGGGGASGGGGSSGGGGGGGGKRGGRKEDSHWYSRLQKVSQSADGFCLDWCRFVVVLFHILFDLGGHSLG